MLDTNVLFEGLKRGLWREAPVRDLFLSSIAASMTPEDVTKDVASKMIELEESLLAHAVNISPKGRPWFKKLGTGQSNPFLPSLATDFPAAALRLSQSTNFLFMVSVDNLMLCRCVSRNLHVLCR